MKSFDKRKVPGLEDCSSDDDDEDELAPKRRCNLVKDFEDDAQEFEIEIEVHENEFLQEEPINSNSEIPKKTNNVWGNVVQENLLDECFNKVGVNQMNVRRNVESYTLQNGDKHPRKRKHVQRSNGNNKYEYKDVKQRIETRSFNKYKDRSHTGINPETDSQQTIVFEIARLLQEPKIELIERCFNALGKEKCLEFYYMTEDIEENGGLLVVNGSRRRTAGGVFLTLIKESDHVNEACKRFIFQYDFNNRRIAQPRSVDKGKIYDLQLDCNKIAVALKSETNTDVVSNLNVDGEKVTELEEGEAMEEDEVKEIKIQDDLQFKVESTKEGNQIEKVKELEEVEKLEEVEELEEGEII